MCLIFSHYLEIVIMCFIYQKIGYKTKPRKQKFEGEPDPSLCNYRILIRMTENHVRLC